MADRKSTRLNSSHLVISYAVFCLKKKNKLRRINRNDKSWSTLQRIVLMDEEQPLFFFFNDTAPTEIYTLSLHDAIPIYTSGSDDVKGSAAMRPARVGIATFTLRYQ